MLESIAPRSLDAAAAKLADVKGKATRKQALQSEAKQLIQGKATAAEMRYSCAIPHVDDASFREAFLSVDEYGEVSEYEERHMEVAAAMIVAALSKTGGFSAPVVYHNV